VETFKGVNSLKGDSAVVQGVKWSEQNKEEKAKKKTSFKLDQDSAWYATEKSELDKTANRLQPCLATLDVGKKLADGDPIFGNYEVTVGARVYANEDATTFTNIPEKDSVITFKKPEADLSKLYEPQGYTNAKSETVTYIDKRFKFDLSKVFPTRKLSVVSVTGRGWQRVTGGYKLYENKADDSWFFNLSMELPKSLLQADELIYQYITYEDKTQTEQNTGAVACKIQVGKISKTTAD